MACSLPTSAFRLLLLAYTDTPLRHSDDRLCSAGTLNSHMHNRDSNATTNIARPSQIPSGVRREERGHLTTHRHGRNSLQIKLARRQTLKRAAQVTAKSSLEARREQRAGGDVTSVRRECVVS
ncbi:hypothetical protein BDV98DRAFT_289441 [Pterulicium gracile]|uniref:Uncharacterized protein n=1 Tax=Pterulicium gracile TaxID=1884261 RepID=A0A5C3QTM8_9AGAR|nr:hypothetical protein BDV98DRAFT_289441 [Pterula gracilis]